MYVFIQMNDTTVSESKVTGFGFVQLITLYNALYDSFNDFWIVLGLDGVTVQSQNRSLCILMLCVCVTDMNEYIHLIT